MALNQTFTDGVSTWGSVAYENTETAINIAVPVGSVIPYVGSSAPNTDWKLLNGQTITNAQSLNAALWAIAPASWRSGSNLVLPNMANRMLEGQSTTALGATGGSNTASITTNELPSHSHTINHDHGAVTSSAVSNDHSHAYSGTTSTNSETGGLPAAGAIYVRINPYTPTSQIGTGGIGIDTPTNTDSSGHAHTYSGNTGGISANHTHSVDLPNFAGNSGSTGSGGALTIVNAHLALNFLIKVV